MIYGGKKFDNTIDENDECFQYNNCSSITIEQFRTYDLTAYALYRLTFGESFDEVKIIYLFN